MMPKSKITIISSSFPYGPKETFLRNEVTYLSRYFDIEIFPVIKSAKNDTPVNVPPNVIFHEPIVKHNYIKRILYGLFNLSPVFPHIKDLFLIAKNPDHLTGKLTRWLLSLLIFRTVYSSSQFKSIQTNSSSLVYFYWGGQPLQLLKRVNKQIFIRIHGNEADIQRNRGYIPLAKYIAVKKNNIHYLPISCNAATLLKSIGDVNYTINRLGVFDNGVNPDEPGTEQIRIVSCSNLIRLKRVHLIIKALSQLDAAVEWIHFGDGPLYEEISELSTGLNKNIVVRLMGRVRNDEILKFYFENHIDLFINVSEIEGVPVSVMEAFSFGIPCFATDVGGTGEIVNDTNGYLADKNFHIEELSAFIVNIRTLSEKHQFRKNARDTWNILCNAEFNYNMLTDLFNKEISSPVPDKLPAESNSGDNAEKV